MSTSPPTSVPSHWPFVNRMSESGPRNRDTGVLTFAMGSVVVSTATVVVPALLWDKVSFPPKLRALTSLLAILTREVSSSSSVSRSIWKSLDTSSEDVSKPKSIVKEDCEEDGLLSNELSADLPRLEEGSTRTPFWPLMDLRKLPNVWLGLVILLLKVVSREDSSDAERSREPKDV